MKKLVLGMLVVGVAIAFAFNVYAAEVTEKTEIKTKGDTTVEKTEVKGGGMKAEQKVTTTPEGTMTEEKMKGKGTKIESKRVDTAAGSAGKTKVKVKKGAIKDLNVEWVYYMDQNKNYIIEYNVKDKTDKELLQALNLTPTEAKMIQPGTHKITSTSPYTAGDVKANFRDIIVRDLASSVKRK
jgi:hypothetical protein